MQHFNRARLCATIMILPLVACSADVDEAGPGSDQSAAPSSQGPASGAATEYWPADGAAPINLRRERRVDLTENGLDERVTVTVRGPAYDALDIDLTIVSAAGDTLWMERWSSMHYFRYTPIDELADSAVVRTVQDHVDALLADDSFSASGLPAALLHGATRAVLRESVTYHLAELDWRRGADLQPSDPMPPQAHSRIRVEHVAQERADVVLDEVLAGPAFMYYAGGEATYAIGWSEREHAFVRLYSCC
jgi:hypothetical protein